MIQPSAPFAQSQSGPSFVSFRLAAEFFDAAAEWIGDGGTVARQRSSGEGLTAEYRELLYIEFEIEYLLGVSSRPV